MTSDVFKLWKIIITTPHSAVLHSICAVLCCTVLYVPGCQVPCALYDQLVGGAGWCRHYYLRGQNRTRQDRGKGGKGKGGRRKKVGREEGEEVGG